MNFKMAPVYKGVTAALGSIFSSPDGEEQAEGRIVIDTDENGEELYKEDIIAKVRSEARKRKDARSAYEQQWILNSNFLVGNQYCDINPYSGEVQQQDSVDDRSERRVFNMIAPLYETRIANLSKVTFGMKAKPRTNELDDYAKAQVTTSILQYKQQQSDFRMKNKTAIAWNELCGSCYWMAWWDKSKGDKIAEKIDVSLTADGVSQENREGFYQGDLEYGILTPYEVLPESLTKQGIDKQRSIIIEQAIPVKEIKDLYGIEVKGDEIATFELTPIASGGGYGYQNTVMALGHKTVSDAQTVLTYFERPSKHLPGGRMIIVIGEEHIAYYGDLPYGRIPIIQTICREIPGQFYGRSVIEDLIPLQKEYNDCKNRLHEHIKSTSIGNIAYEEGSIDVDEYEDGYLEPRRMLSYARGTQPPHYIQTPNLPSEIINEIQVLKNDMEYVAGVSQLMVTGSTPSGVTSGTAIQNLMEIDNTRLSLTGDHIRTAIKNLGMLWLHIYKMYATTPRAVSFVGKNDIAKALTWSKDDIDITELEFITENELLQSDEIQKQRFFEMLNTGMFTDDNGRIPARVKAKAREYMKVGDFDSLMSIDELQLQAANRENVFFGEGVLPEISDFDDHVIHAEEHERYILQMDFKLMKHKNPSLAAEFEKHAKEHKILAERQEVEKQIRLQHTAQELQLQSQQQLQMQAQSRQLPQQQSQTPDTNQ